MSQMGQKTEVAPNATEVSSYLINGHDDELRPSKIMEFIKIPVQLSRAIWGKTNTRGRGLSVRLERLIGRR